MKRLTADQIVTADGEIENGAVLVDDGVITAVGSQTDIDQSACESVSLEGYTLLPGLIDGHVHITGPPVDTGAVEDLTGNSTAEVTVRAIENARRTVEAGVTTIRDLGSPNDVAMTLREAIAAGTFDGPRVLTSGQGLTATAGHGDLVPWHVDSFLETEAGNIGSKGLVADGPTGVRRAVRRQAKLGADLIKVWATDGTGDRGGGRILSFSPAELEAIVDEATRLDLPVAAHAHGAQAIKVCVEAGVRSIEHGMYMDEEAVDVMAESGTYLTFTYATMEEMAYGEAYGYDSTKQALEHQRSMLSYARERGVNFAMGTDAGTVTANGENGVELEHLVDRGFDPLEAIEICTAGSAAMLGLDSVGRLEAGYTADLIAVRGDPLTDVSVLQDPDRIDLVMRDGRELKNRVS